MNKVLIVDDDDAVLGFLSEALVSEGYEVKTAANGSEALRVLEGWRADLILLDLMMPVMDGWAFRSHQSRRREIAQIPVIALSAVSNLTQRAAELGVKAIQKPFDLDELLDYVRQQLTPSSSQAHPSW